MDDTDPVRAAYDASYARLVTQVLALCGNRAEAEDIVQEAFLAAMSHRREFAEVGNREAWLRTASINLLRNRWRRARVFGRIVPRLRDQVAFDPGPDASADHLSIVAALAQLSRPTRETVVLHYIADLSVMQVSREQGIPVGTVKARLSRARTLLAGLLTEREEADHV